MGKSLEKAGLGIALLILAAGSLFIQYIEIIVILAIAIGIFWFVSGLRKERKNEAEIELLGQELSELGEIELHEPSQIGYRPVRGESSFFKQDNVILIEDRKTGRISGAGLTLSVPLGFGLRARAGTGAFDMPKKPMEVDNGRLIITDKAIVFEGHSQNHRITWGQIAAVAVSRYFVQINRRNGKAIMLGSDYFETETLGLLEHYEANA